MKLWTSVRTFLAYALRRSSAEREMEEELRSHLQIRADDLALWPVNAKEESRLHGGCRDHTWACHR